MTDQYAPLEGQLEEVKCKLLARHEGETIEFSTCPNNGCFDMCVLKQHVKNGKVVSIETDDSIHKGMGREDEYCPWEDIQLGMYQKRACVRGRGQRSDAYSPTRLLYPMKRKGPKPSWDFERISWDEALDEIANKYMETREKYGPLSVYSDGMQGQTWDPFGEYMGGAIALWGEDSFEPTNTADMLTYNIQNTLCFGIDGLSENQTFFDAKAIILIGFDAAINYPETVYYLLLAKEKGVPIITIDPRYTWTAEAIGTQHIFIRPGTDLALLEAMAYVLFSEELYDKEFCDQWVEPEGFELYRAYITGIADGEIPKTPEWAEGITGIPAETIYDLARFYGEAKPCYIRMVWAAARQVYGKQAARGLNYLQALGGNIGHNGCAGSGVGFSGAEHIMTPFAFMPQFMGETGPTTPATVCMEAEMWHRAILLRQKVDAGEMDLEDYKAEIGCPKNTEAPNIHMMLCINSNRNHLSGWYGCNERREAMLAVDYIAFAHYNLRHPSIPYADIVLPISSPFIEGVNQIPSSPHMGSYTIGINTGTQNAMMYGRGGGDLPGETRPMGWIIKQIADRMGIGDKIMPVMESVGWEQWADKTEEVAHDVYDFWKNIPAPDGQMMPDVPEWEEFRKYPIYRRPMDSGYHVFARAQIEGGAPFPTQSGKIEFYSKWVAENDLTVAPYPDAGQKCFGKGNLPPMAKYKHTPEGMMSPKTLDYPLYMVTPHSFYRHHCAYDHSLWYRDEFRNSVWMSVSDAKARGIKDGDKVHVHSTVGECLLTAYVTSRMTPGVCCIIFGRWYEPSGIKTELMPGGIDTRGDCNFLIPSDFYDDVLGADLNNALVQIELAEDYLKLDKLMEVK